MIYFDNAATSATLPEALTAFVKNNSENYGNPSSNHAFGRASSLALNDARVSILKDLGCLLTHNLVFTSGATESNNLAIKGLAFHYLKRGRRIITSAVEHPSVLNVVKELIPFGFDVVVLPVNSRCVVEPETLNNAMTKDTILVSLMAVNNEVGSIFDVSSLADVVHHFPKAFFHVDATQAVGKVKLPYQKADLISFSAHKFGGLKGSGALVYKKSIVFSPVNMGGEQEYGFRGGTVNTPSCVAEAVAFHHGQTAFDENQAIVREINNYLRSRLAEIPGVSINSPQTASPYVLNVSLLKKKASVIVEALSEKGVYVSSVSACSSKGEPISYVLQAMGKSEDEARNSIRLSFSPYNTLAEAEQFMTIFSSIMERTIDR